MQATPVSGRVSRTANFLPLTCRSNPLQLLLVALLCLHLLPPWTLCDNLRCYYSPILEKETPFELIVTECPPDELCFKGDGRYGNYSALTARGCMAEADCSQVHPLRIRGVDYSMSFDCCDWPYCNSCPGVSAGPIYVAATFFTVAAMAGAL